MADTLRDAPVGQEIRRQWCELKKQNQQPAIVWLGKIEMALFGLEVDRLLSTMVREKRPKTRRFFGMLVLPRRVPGVVVEAAAEGELNGPWRQVDAYRD